MNCTKNNQIHSEYIERESTNSKWYGNRHKCNVSELIDFCMHCVEKIIIACWKICVEVEDDKNYNLVLNSIKSHSYTLILKYFQFNPRS
jgi:hypothetical protein